MNFFKCMKWIDEKLNERGSGCFLSILYLVLLYLLLNHISQKLSLHLNLNTLNKKLLILPTIVSE